MVSLATIGFALLALIAVPITLFGLLMWFAGGMSDDPSSGAGMGKNGCIVTLVGLAILGIALWRAVS
jgi:hypothetical protein